MLRSFLLVIMIIPSIYSMYQSNIKFTSTGLEYRSNNNIQLISIKTLRSKMLCCAACNQLSSCRIFDYDTLSKRCRLYEGDTTTGSIISSPSSTSVVGTVYISSTLYSSINNQTCQACEQNRYSTCSTNTSRCQCPTHTYWNGSVCALQRFENDTCDQPNACRADLNLTCLTDCYGQFPKCTQSLYNGNNNSSSMKFGITIAGVCSATLNMSQTTINLPRDILIFGNNTLYVSDGSDKVFAFQPNNRTASIVKTFGDWLGHFFYDNKSSNFYGSVFNDHLVYIWPLGKTIPPSGIQQGNCSFTKLFFPTGVTVDSSGNVYIASFLCHWVTKWAPNATSSTLVVGSPTANSGSDSQSLTFPSALLLDQSNSYLYVADRYNHRIQRFVLGSNVGVTVAGGYGSGSAPNQLDLPSDIYLSKTDGSLYIADSYNHRIQKWTINSTVGITVAGSSNGQAGSTSYLMNVAIALSIDDEERYLYVSDFQNDRVQRFYLQ